MHRERRIPLLVLAALCASAIVPSTSAAEVRFAAPPGAALEARQAGPDVFAAGGIEKECDPVELRVTALDSSRTLELAPLYGECTTKALNGLPTKMVWWDCGYQLHPFARANRKEVWEAKVDIACPNEHVIEWNVYESEAAYNIADTLCVTTMPPQRAGGVAELSNAPGSPGEVVVSWKLSGIEYEAFGSSLFCGLTPGATKDDAFYTGRAVIGAVNLAGQPADLRLEG